MKLCQRCTEALMDTVSLEDCGVERPYPIAPDSKCEHWVHKELNKHLPRFGKWIPGPGPAVVKRDGVQVQFDEYGAIIRYRKILNEGCNMSGFRESS